MSRPRAGSGGGEIGGNPYDLKTITAGAVLCLGLIMISQYAPLLGSDRMAQDHMPAGGVFIFFVLCLIINPLLKIVSASRFYFSPRSLLVIWIMLLVTASVSGKGLTSQFLPILAGLGYFASPENRWEELVLPHVKDWLIPRDMEAIRGFYEGGAAVPWGYWAGVVLPWLFFLVCLFFTSVCVISIFRKQWVENERVLFPINELPIAMSEGAGGKELIGSFFSNRLMWAGFAVAFALGSLRGLNAFFPFIQPVELFELQTFRVFRGTVSLAVLVSFPVMGFIYFVNTHLSFSLWFFALFFYTMAGIFNMTGIASEEFIGMGSYHSPLGTIFVHFSSGAFFGFVFASFWMARKHLGEVYRKALGRGSGIDDSGEMLSYRFSFWGGITGVVLMVAWLAAAGMTVPVAFLFVFLMFVFLYGLTKIIAQSGLITMKPPSIPQTQIISLLGSANVGEENISHMVLHYGHHSALRTFPFSAAFHGVKLGERIRRNIKPVFWIIMLTLPAGFIISSALLLHLGYSRGIAYACDWFFERAPQFPFNTAAEHIMHPRAVFLDGIAYRAAGLVLMFFLTFMHYRFLWWPLHPIGLAAASTYRVLHPWFSIFLGFLCKVMILKFGGPRAYANFKPLFFGLIVGTYVAGGIWLLISLATGRPIGYIFRV